MPNCLIIYVGNGYSERETSYDGSYQYSVDMRDNRPNHTRNIIEPLKKMGYNVDISLITNKHLKYELFLKEYNAINVNYDDITPIDESNLYRYYALKVPEEHGPGSLKSGGRVLKAKRNIPEYDLYLFVRADAKFKLSLNELNIDYTKMNYSWKETDYRFFTDERHSFMKQHGTDHVYWNEYYRISGNVLNIVPKKYFNTFTSYYWLEHLSLYCMTQDLSPIITYKNDVNLIFGEDKCYVTDIRFCENPLYTFNKKLF